MLSAAVWVGAGSAFFFAMLGRYTMRLHKVNTWY
jgi:hypothetical protein